MTTRPDPTVRPAVTRAVVLTRRPQGQFTAADLGLAEFPLAELGEGQALVRNTYMSIDPSTRGRMDATEKQYTTTRSNRSISGDVTSPWTSSSKPSRCMASSVLYD